MTLTHVHTCDFAKFDLSGYPMVLVTLLDVDPNEDQIREYVRLQEELIDSRTGKFVIVVDGGELNWINGAARILLNGLIAEFEHRNRERLLKTFMVTRTVFHKIALKGFNRINKPIVPQVVLQSLGEALEMAADVLSHDKDEPT